MIERLFVKCQSLALDQQTNICIHTDLWFMTNVTPLSRHGKIQFIVGTNRRKRDLVLSNEAQLGPEPGQGPLGR